LGTTLHHSKSAVNGSVFTKLYFASKLSDLGTEDRQKSLRGVEVWTKRNTPYRPILISADAKKREPVFISRMSQRGTLICTNEYTATVYAFRVTAFEP